MHSYEQLIDLHDDDKHALRERAAERPVPTKANSACVVSDDDLEQPLPPPPPPARA